MRHHSFFQQSCAAHSARARRQTSSASWRPSTHAIGVVVAWTLTLVVAHAPGVCSAETIENSGSVTAVTLYRGQALVQRTINVTAPAGTHEVVVTNLPEQVDPTSLFAEGAEGASVRAVRFRQRTIGQEPRDDVRAAEAELAATRQKILMNEKMVELSEKQMKYLDGLDAFAGPTAKKELVEGTLDATALQTVTEFTFKQRKEILEQQVNLSLEAAQLKESLAQQERKLAQLTEGAEKAVREAVVFLDKQDGAAQTIRLNYLVTGCAWSPTYAVRAETGREMVRLEYNALIQQVSGEDWTEVELTLSTASPALSSAGPTLAPFQVSLRQHAAAGEAVANAPPVDVQSKLQKLYGQQQINFGNAARSATFKDNLNNGWLLNDVANSVQNIELNYDIDTVVNARGSIGTEPTLSYTLGAPVSLATRRDQQIVRIAHSQLPSHFYHVATPVLSHYVYREAELNNASEFDLLGGDVQVYLDNRFVGRTELPTVSRGQTFFVGFGADPQLRARRELIERTDDVQGGNRELGFVYRLRVENYKDVATNVRVLDRMPTSASNGQIRVTLANGGDSLSDDKSYQELERPKGLLRWDIDVAANTAGQGAQLIDYEYTVEYDRQFTLTATQQSQEQQQQEFEQLLRQRQLR